MVPEASRKLPESHRDHAVVVAPYHCKLARCYYHCQGKKVRAQPYESKLLPLRGLTPDIFWRVKRKITMLLTKGGSAWRSRRLGERVPSPELHLIDHLILIPSRGTIVVPGVEALAVAGAFAFRCLASQSRPIQILVTSPRNFLFLKPSVGKVSMRPIT